MSQNSIGQILSIRDRLASFLGFSHRGTRDLYEAFGYERVVVSERLYAMYRRNDIANRIIRIFSKSTWREAPIICEGDRDDEASHDTPFTRASQEFMKQWGFIQMMERFDRLGSIGRFGLLVMGFSDGRKISQPLEGKANLVFMQPYAEHNVTVAQWDTNPASPRYGLPVVYTVNVGQPTEESQSPARSLTVHHTRCLHVSEFLDEDEVYGLPRLLPIFNRLLDLEKVIGGSAETFWLTANRGVAFWADPDANLTDAQIEDIKDQTTEFEHKLRRVLVGQGMQAQVLGSEIPAPRENVDTLLDVVAGAVGVPKRILIGSERGELASSQDENNWASQIEERRSTFAAPRIAMPFFRMMIATGNLPAPTDKWEVYWVQNASLTPLQEAELAKNRTEALAAYVNAPGADLIVTPNEFRTDFLGMEPLPDDALDEEEGSLFDEPDEEELDEEEPVEEEDADPEQE